MHKSKYLLLYVPMSIVFIHDAFPHDTYQFTMVFDDISIVAQHHATTDLTNDLYSYCIQIFSRKSHRFHFDIKYIGSDANRVTFKNTRTVTNNVSCYDCNFVSDIPLPSEQTSYFEVEYLSLGTANKFNPSPIGIGVGITSNTTGYSQVTSAIFADCRGLYELKNTEMIGITNITKARDVFSVLVDRRLNQVVFFKNGEKVGIGKSKPWCKQYAFFCLQHAGEALQVVEKYTYHELRDKYTI